jgi:hypothetical protein
MTNEAKAKFEKWSKHFSKQKNDIAKEAYLAGYQAGLDSIELKGACPTCEPVGELNVMLQAQLSQVKKANDELSERLSEAEKVIEFYSDKVTECWVKHTHKHLFKDDGKRARDYQRKYNKEIEG